MSEIARLFKYKQLLGGGRALSSRALMDALEISHATLKRDIAKLRDQFNMPVRFDRERSGYVLDDTPDQVELPGLWLDVQEIDALVTVQYLLSQLEPGLLGPKLRPLQNRLHKLLTEHGQNPAALADHVRVVHAGKRHLSPRVFEVAASATLARRRLRITHHNRSTGEHTTRDVSPQRLVHYRDNWYLDAWCHLRDDLRSFALDAVEQARPLKAAAQEVPPRQIDDTLGGGYGIFGGEPRAWATLRFSPQRARWVRGEQWHPQQRQRAEPDGSLTLSVPYSDDRELIGDILRHGAEVQVIAPADLRAKVRKELLRAAEGYGEKV